MENEQELRNLREEYVTNRLTYEFAWLIEDMRNDPLVDDKYIERLNAIIKLIDEEL